MFLHHYIIQHMCSVIHRVHILDDKLLFVSVYSVCLVSTLCPLLKWQTLVHLMVCPRILCATHLQIQVALVQGMLLYYKIT